MKKMRVWWIPQVGVDAIFYIPVDNEEEAKKFMDVLAAYDCFQYNHEIKSDCCNFGEVEVWDAVDEDWVEWHYDDYGCSFTFDEYCDEASSPSDQLKEFTKAVLGRVKFD